MKININSIVAFISLLVFIYISYRISGFISILESIVQREGNEIDQFLTTLKDEIQNNSASLKTNSEDFKQNLLNKIDAFNNIFKNKSLWS
jgi:predicted PurR-regulated permease PerM